MSFLVVFAVQISGTEAREISVFKDPQLRILSARHLWHGSRDLIDAYLSDPEEQCYRGAARELERNRNRVRL